MGFLEATALILAVNFVVVVVNNVIVIVVVANVVVMAQFVVTDNIIFNCGQ